MNHYRFGQVLILLMFAAGAAHAETAGTAGGDVLVIADKGKSIATIIVSKEAGPWEQRAAEDLSRYIRRMSGAEVALASEPAAQQKALQSNSPVLLVGQAALAADSSLAKDLATVAKTDPVIRSDAIVVRRTGSRVLLAGANDDSHYYAVAKLLRLWGCRWYLPTEFGECIPRHAQLAVGELNHVYAPPFEVRRYWLSWNGDSSGKEEFMRRNFFNDISVPNGHALGRYTKELIPPGGTMFNVPISEEKTAQHVAAKVLPQYAAGENIMLGMEDGIYQSDSAEDKKLISLQYDKYFLTQSYTDAFMVFYNNLAAKLQAAAPHSESKIGFLIYSNITLPPVRDIVAAEPLVGYLAPIDIDPIHGMDDPRSAPRREYKDILYAWAKVMQGRLVIYDYDQSMLVWRDIPNPSHQAFRHDVQHYRKAGILGVDVESRGAMATTFTNLYLRGELMWNPDADVDALLAEFYTKFYGPAAAPMAKYWNAIFAAWESTLVTEHEYFVAPAIYTPELVATLEKHLLAAEKAVAPLKQQTGAPAKQYTERVGFTRLSFEVLDAYMDMVHAANAEIDYKAAVAAGERGLATREKLTEMNGVFTTYKRIGEHGYAWWPGEVKQYRELLPYTNGERGALVAKTPLVWNFRRDPGDLGVKEKWFAKPVDLTWYKEQPQPLPTATRIAHWEDWEQIRTDLYAQAQGIVTADHQSYTGHMWYHTPLELSDEDAAGSLHLRMPGMFNEAWLYINGQEVAHRPMKDVWWKNDYRFEWDVDVAGKLKPGVNSIFIRLYNPHHFGGLFRRPFLYRATATQSPSK